jgi:hypothetical protein
VTVNAGPFADMWTLADLPDVADVSIRSFEGTRALMDVRLTGVVDLAAEMRRAMPFTAGVVEVGDRVLVIDVGAPTSSSRRSPSSAAGIGRGRQAARSPFPPALAGRDVALTWGR